MDMSSPNRVYFTILTAISPSFLPSHSLFPLMSTDGVDYMTYTCSNITALLLPITLYDGCVWVCEGGMETEGQGELVDPLTCLAS